MNTGARSDADAVADNGVGADLDALAYFRSPVDNCRFVNCRAFVSIQIAVLIVPDAVEKSCLTR